MSLIREWISAGTLNRLWCNILITSYITVLFVQVWTSRLVVDPHQVRPLSNLQIRSTRTAYRHMCTRKSDHLCYSGKIVIFTAVSMRAWVMASIHLELWKIMHVFSQLLAKKIGGKVQTIIVNKRSFQELSEFFKLWERFCVLLSTMCCYKYWWVMPIEVSILQLIKLTNYCSWNV